MKVEEKLADYQKLNNQSGKFLQNYTILLIGQSLGYTTTKKLQNVNNPIHSRSLETFETSCTSYSIVCLEESNIFTQNLKIQQRILLVYLIGQSWNTEAKIHMLSLTEHARQFYNNALRDTLENALSFRRCGEKYSLWIIGEYE